MSDFPSAEERMRMNCGQELSANTITIVAAGPLVRRPGYEPCRAVLRLLDPTTGYLSKTEYVVHTQVIAEDEREPWYNNGDYFVWRKGDTEEATLKSKEEAFKRAQKKFLERTIKLSGLRLQVKEVKD